MSTVDARQFETYRPLMFSIAYRMLGSVTEAEDIVQEAYLRYQATPADEIVSHKAFLSTIVTRLCLNQLQSARAQLAGPHASDLFRADEPGLLQDADVLLHAREGHAERLSELGDRSVCTSQLLQHAAPGGVRNRSE